MTEQSLEQKARRVAKKAGFTASKSRWRANSVDNLGGFRIVDPYRNYVEAGVKYDLSAEQVIEFCQENRGRLARA
jgi:hypothetical protein